MRQLIPYLLVGIGGFLGANARFIVGTWVTSTLGSRVPLGTFVVNVSGCLLIGILGTVIVDKLVARPEHVQWLLAIGFLGAYTTFSSFAWENHLLFLEGRWLTAALYMALSVFAGLIAVQLGVLLARAWF
ncbi:MAG TPA: fluoride efflux transporter CrcB [Nitrospiria bacterium]|nr:fluoride efflux transporter CrcB [Nitrospiria bacterium]